VTLCFIMRPILEKAARLYLGTGPMEQVNSLGRDRFYTMQGDWIMEDLT
jgi:hypothetical protein